MSYHPAAAMHSCCQQMRRSSSSSCQNHNGAPTEPKQYSKGSEDITRLEASTKPKPARPPTTLGQDQGALSIGPSINLRLAQQRQPTNHLLRCLASKCSSFQISEHRLSQRAAEESPYKTKALHRVPQLGSRVKSLVVKLVGFPRLDISEYCTAASSAWGC